MSEQIKYLCRIHTKQYSGNFHHELGVYITGIPDESCQLDEEQVEDMDDEIADWFDDNIIQHLHDEYGYQTCTMIQSPDGKYNSVQLSFYEDIPQNIRDFILQRVTRYAQGGISRMDQFTQDGGRLDIISIEYLKQTTRVAQETI